MNRDITIRKFHNLLRAHGFRSERNARDEYVSKDGAIAVPAVMKDASWARGDEAIDRRQTLLAIHVAQALQNETTRVGARVVG